MSNPDALHPHSIDMAHAMLEGGIRQGDPRAVALASLAIQHSTLPDDTAVNRSAVRLATGLNTAQLNGTPTADYLSEQSRKIIES